MPLVDLDRFAQIQQNAYAGVNNGTIEERQQLVAFYTTLIHASECTFIGYYNDNHLLGAAIIYHFTLNYCGEMVPATGIGSVAIDLLHKKEGIAKSLLLYWLKTSGENGALVASLYPFNAAFYNRFGFGFGTPLYFYQTPPKNFSSDGDKSLVQWLDLESSQDLSDMDACYKAFFLQQHGMMQRTDIDYLRLKRQKNLKGIKVVEVQYTTTSTTTSTSTVTGYMLFEQKGITPSNFLQQTLNVSELITLTPTAARAISAFFHAQADQIDYVNHRSYDPMWYHSLLDLSYASKPELLPQINHKVADMGLGMMWRVLEPQKLLQMLPPLSFSLQFHIADMHSKHIHIYPVPCTQARASSTDNADSLQIHCDEALMSSLLMGALSLRTAIRNGNAKMRNSDGPLPLIQADKMARTIDLTWSLEVPQCLTRF